MRLDMLDFFVWIDESLDPFFAVHNKKRADFGLFRFQLFQFWLFFFTDKSNCNGERDIEASGRHRPYASVMVGRCLVDLDLPG